MARPGATDLPRWANVSGAVTTPSSGRQDEGWLAGDTVPAQWLNWLFRQSWTMLEWLRVHVPAYDEPNTFTDIQSLTHATPLGLTAAGDQIIAKTNAGKLEITNAVSGSGATAELLANGTAQLRSGTTTALVQALGTGAINAQATSGQTAVLQAIGSPGAALEVKPDGTISGNGARFISAANPSADTDLDTQGARNSALAPAPVAISSFNAGFLAGAIPPKYTKIGNQIFLQGSINAPSGGCAAGTFMATLPSSAAFPAATRAAANSRETGAGPASSCLTVGTSGGIYTQTALSTGDVVYLDGVCYSL